MGEKSYIVSFKNTGLGDLQRVGGKNASLGEMVSELASKGITVPDGFAVTSDAYWEFLKFNDLGDKISDLLEKIDHHSYTNLDEVSLKIRQMMLTSEVPSKISQEI